MLSPQLITALIKDTIFYKWVTIREKKTYSGRIQLERKTDNLNSILSWQLCLTRSQSKIIIGSTLATNRSCICRKLTRVDQNSTLKLLLGEATYIVSFLSKIRTCKVLALLPRTTYLKGKIKKIICRKRKLLMVQIND